MKNYIGVDVSYRLPGYSEPKEWTNHHMTVFFLGRKVPSIALMAAVKSVRQFNVFGFLTDITTFSDVPVALYDLNEGNDLVTLRERLFEFGLKENTEFKWTPHVTLKALRGVDILVPGRPFFHRPYIKIDESKIYF